MIHVVVIQCLIGLPLIIHIELLRRSRLRSFKNRGAGVGVGSSKNRGVESELLCTDSTALPQTTNASCAFYVTETRYNDGKANCNVYTWHVIPS
jgi:hypothetical protein